MRGYTTSYPLQTQCSRPFCGSLRPYYTLSLPFSHEVLYLPPRKLFSVAGLAVRSSLPIDAVVNLVPPQLV